MYERILLTTDFSEPSLRLLSFTTGLAKRLGARIFLLHVDEEESMFSLHSSEELIRFFRDVEVKRDEWMDRLCDDITARGVTCTQVRARGAASDEILAAIERYDIDLAAMATVGVEGMKRILIGSTTKKVLFTAPCAMLSVNPEYDGTCDGSGCRRILYPFDFSDTARAGLEKAARLAEKLDATIELLKVLKIPTLIPSLPGEPPITLPHSSLEYLEQDSRAELDEVVAEAGSDRFTHAVAIGSDEAETIADYAAENDVDMVLITRGGEGAFKRFFFGRVAHAVIKLTRVPVLSLPSPE